MKKYILGVAILGALVSCESKKEKQAEELQLKVDSLTVELEDRQLVERQMDEVGTLIDSIDASRKLLKINMIEGSTYADHVGRLQDINEYVKETEAKIEALEKSNTKASAANASYIKRLKADLANKTQEVLELQLQLAQFRKENMELWARVNHKDSILLMKDQVIKLKDSDIANLERLAQDTNAENRVTVSNLYYQQAEALETAANRTQFAPRKKKEARTEALELYKLSLSLGNTDAQVKIDALEKKLD